jgi:hypothetical protein
MRGTHLQVLQLFLVGFEATLFLGCAAMTTEKYDHLEIPVHNNVENRMRRDGKMQWSPTGLPPLKGAMIGRLGHCPINTHDVNPSDN